MNDAKFRVQSLSAKNRTIHVFPKNEVGEIIKCLSLSSCPARVLNEKRAEKLHHKEVSEQNKHIKEEQKKKKVTEKKSLNKTTEEKTHFEMVPSWESFKENLPVESSKRGPEYFHKLSLAAKNYVKLHEPIKEKKLENQIKEGDQESENFAIKIPKRKLIDISNDLKPLKTVRRTPSIIILESNENEVLSPDASVSPPNKKAHIETEFSNPRIESLTTKVNQIEKSLKIMEDYSFLL
jgi:hypothetical protein